MRQSFRARPKPFLDASRRRWQLDAFAWLLRSCGGYPRFLETALVLPVERHFPDRGLTGHAAAAALFRRVRDHAGMADWPCIVEREPADAQPQVREPAPERLRVIYYPAVQLAPEVLVAHFAHELARYLIESFDEAPPPGGRPGAAVDLATVFMGFGVFMANSAAAGVRWDLNESELVHALALFCHLRQVPAEEVEPHLNAHVRKYLRLAFADLAQHGRDFQQLRAVFPVLAAAECTLPSR